jgi:hypothetical protein
MIKLIIKIELIYLGINIYIFKNYLEKYLIIIYNSII